MKKNLKTAGWLMAVIIAVCSIVAGCKKNTELDDSSPAADAFLPGNPSASKALNTVISNLESQFLQNDYRANFINWHGQPLWDKAIQLKKDETNAILLIPVSKGGNIEAFIAAKVKDGTVVYELHRRKAVEAKVQEPSGVNINAAFSRGMLAYFNNSIYNKVDQVPDAVYYTLQKAAERNGDAAPSPDKMVSVAICYNVGYCTDCPNAPEVCCYTQKVCFNITYDDGTGGGIIIGGGTGGGGGPHGGPGPGSGNCPPVQANWYTENVVPAPCEGNGGACNMSAAEAQALLNGGVLSHTNTYTVINGLQTAPDANGIIRKPKIVKWEFVKYTLYNGLFVRYTALYEGTVYKNGANDPNWKWERLSKVQKVYQSENTLPPCVGSTIDYTAGTPIIQQDPQNVSLAISGTVRMSVTCITGMEFGSHQFNHPAWDFDANWD